MTEDQIERIFEREMDQFDRMLTKGIITQEEYDEEVAALDEWARETYNKYRGRLNREW